MPRCSLPHLLLDFEQFLLGLGQFDLLLSNSCADVPGDIEVEAFLGDAVHAHTFGVAVFFLAELVGLYDLDDVLVSQLVLTLALRIVLGRVDEEDVIGLLTLLKH